MAQRYADYYTDKSKILTLLEHGNPIERQIALGSLVIHFRNEDHYDLCWRIFLSDEHFDVKREALSVALMFASKYHPKRIWEIASFIENSDHRDIRNRSHERMILRDLIKYHKEGVI